MVVRRWLATANEKDGQISIAIEQLEIALSIAIEVESADAPDIKDYLGYFKK